jgi:hypothetical protein
VNDTNVTPTSAPGTAPTLDAKNPWLGLASFTEETRRYFYGREAEAAELARRVQRKLLTVLFGQSGLGKTSILRAGLVPKLRTQGYCPVYVRIDYGRDAPEPADQIKSAIAAAARLSGEWTQVGVAIEGESLWEFLHHRDDVLRDASGHTLVPLLIFDQFEEIFTLAQSDEFGRARAARLISELSDLVENRAPKDLEARLEQDDAAAGRFDFARSDYRVLISLREDYLAPLESLKASMPSITQNRLRLAPMTGTQALEAVLRPGGKLVTEDVAAALVRFVAGGAEIANAEVEPSLLSLICRELNDKRIAKGGTEISLDLLAGSHATILAEFYERTLADQPAAVRHSIEDELLTGSGFRESIAEERILAMFAAAGAAPATLPLLVNRRLLRIEERLDVRRVELTHDVLCAVVKASRDLRYEREARDRTEKLLSEQRERELAARQALVRARRIATGCATLAVCAVVALAFAFISLRRAHRAEMAAQESRAAAETARSQAEHLLGYLNEDFAVELAGFGTLDLVKQLGEREMQYYDALPASLRTTDSVRSAALARARYGIAQQQAYDLKGARASLTSAVATLERLRNEGDTSEGSAIALSIGLAALADVNDRSGISGETERYNTRAEALLRTYVDAPNPSVAIRRAYGQVAMSVGSYAAGEQALALFARSKQALESIGALSLQDLPASADYTTVLSLEALDLWRLGRIDELKKVSDQGMHLANEIIARRPGHIVAFEARATLNALSASPAHEALHISDSVAFMKRALEDGLLLLRLDPANVDTRGSTAGYAGITAGFYEELGQPRAALGAYQHGLEIVLGSRRGAADHGDAVVARYAAIARLNADLGERAASDAAINAAEPALVTTTASMGDKSFNTARARCSLANARAQIALLSGDSKQAVALAEPTLASGLTLVEPVGHIGGKSGCVSEAALTLSNAQLTLGNYDAANTAAASAVPLVKMENDWVSRNYHAALVVLQVIAMSRLGQTTEARALVTPIVDWQRERFTRNHDDSQQRLDYASALYALALTDSAHRGEMLRQASGIIAALPSEMRSLKSTRMWRDRVAAEEAAPRSTKNETLRDSII